MVLVLGLPSKSPGKHLKNLKKKISGPHALKFSLSMSGVEPEN